MEATASNAHLKHLLQSNFHMLLFSRFPALCGVASICLEDDCDHDSVDAGWGKVHRGADEGSWSRASNPGWPFSRGSHSNGGVPKVQRRVLDSVCKAASTL